MKYRPCTCLDCKHKWPQTVEYSETTQNLSGEKNIYCPQCRSKNVMAGPVAEDHDHIFTAGIGTVEGGSVKIVKQKQIRQADMTADCWSIQLWGIEHCKTCEYLETEDCGGVDLIKAIQAGTYPAAGLPDQGGV